MPALPEPQEEPAAWSVLRCYMMPDIRSSYHTEVRLRRSDIREASNLPPGPPTEFCPGSVEKLKVMAQRAEQGLPICSPDDADFEGSGTAMQDLEGAAYREAIAWTNADGSTGCSISGATTIRKGKGHHHSKGRK